MQQTITYTFHPVPHCNMCGSTRFRRLGKRLNGPQGLHPLRKSGITTTVMKCRNCGLIFSDPMPLPLHFSDHYGIPPEDYWKEEYFAVDVNSYAASLETYKGYIRNEGPLRSLDIGAGLGKYMLACSAAGFEAWGCEASEPFRQRAIEKMNIPPEQLVLGQVEEIDFPEAHFDYISFKAVLEHLSDPSAMLAKARLWLKPGGVIMIAGPSANWLISRMINTYYQMRLWDFTSHISPMHQPFHLYEFSLKSFVENAGRNQFRILYHHYDVCDTYMPRIMRSPMRSLMKATNSGMDLTVLLGRDS